MRYPALLVRRQHERMFAYWADGKWSADAAGGCFAPQVFEPVVLPCLRREDVHDHVPVVHEDPAGLAVALGAAGQQALAGGICLAALLQLLEDAVMDRLRLALRVAGA